ncbi:MAG TPA: folylpolyglutamate synthase/dihydrofolate synthase family protein [Edaphobacter sp.]|jgi:dihydrofolate synthase/folylpolyglutamate synthase|nr:folylpolyglutamate synthase/dihydrofolate synthase family protein [Edaphobacter sp.]
MSYAAAVDHLYALGHELAPASPNAPRRKFDLAHMRVLAAALGNCQTSFPSVLIAGTNGKGSTAATLASILTAAGYRTGLYTSPHLIRVNERIQIDSVPISDEDFARLYFYVDETARRLVSDGDLPHSPSFFEVLTALAFVYFAGAELNSSAVDIVVLEVGLGGRLDATNIVDPLLSIITDIALDHQDFLGDTITEITREKAGILRPNGTLITLPQHPEANQTIGEAATALHVRAINAANFIPPQTPGSQASENPRISPEAQPLPRNHYTLNLNQEPLEIDSPLTGQHQQRNIALAIAAAIELRNQESYKSNPNSLISDKNSYKITNEAIETGIRNTRWPGRLELLPLRANRTLLLDVAHNPAGAWTLRAAIAQLPESQPRTLLFSCLRDKNLKEMAQILFPLFDSTSTDPARLHDQILFAPIDNPRAASLEDLQAAALSLDIPAHTAPNLAAAFEQAQAVTPPNGILIATGSVYLVGDIRHLAEQA